MKKIKRKCEKILDILFSLIALFQNVWDMIRVRILFDLILI